MSDSPMLMLRAQLRALQSTLDPRRPPAPAEVRAWLDAMSPGASPGLDVRAMRIEGSLDGSMPAVDAEWIVPRGADPTLRLVYLHGGGYVAGSPRSHRGLAARLARAAGCVALVPDYRLAPEHPCPAAIEDARRALAHAFDHGPDGPAPAARVLLAGDSAGGGLALATALAARDRGERLPARMATLSAWTDLACTGASMTSRAEVEAMLPVPLIRDWPRHYLGGRDATDPAASPLYADLADLPPLLMQVGDAEVLLDDTVRFAAKAEKAGVDVRMEVFPEAFHVFQAFAGSLPEGRAALASLGAFLVR